MAWLKKAFFNLRCDRCGDICDMEMWHDDPDTLAFVAAEQRWVTVGGKHYCPDCYVYDDDNNVKIKTKKIRHQQKKNL